MEVMRPDLISTRCIVSCRRRSTSSIICRLSPNEATRASRGKFDNRPRMNKVRCPGGLPRNVGPGASTRRASASKSAIPPRTSVTSGVGKRRTSNISPGSTQSCLKAGTPRNEPAAAASNCPDIRRKEPISASPRMNETSRCWLSSCSTSRISSMGVSLTSPSIITSPARDAWTLGDDAPGESLSGWRSGTESRRPDGTPAVSAVSATRISSGSTPKMSSRASPSSGMVTSSARDAGAIGDDAPGESLSGRRSGTA